VIVSGNHDSPTLLEAPKEILENFGVHVIGGAESPEDEVIELKDKAGNLEGVVCAVPFLRERDILRLKDDSTLSRAEEIQLAVENHYKSVVKAAIDRMGAKRVPLIATGHLFTVGSPKGEDVNELYIGATGAVPVNIFPSEIYYLALGHIHRAYSIGGDKTRNYCGAPIPLTFEEANLEKLVRLVDFEPDEIKVADIQVPKFDRLVSVQGSQTEISTKLKELAGQDEKILVEVIHTGKANAINLTGEVSEQTSGTKIEVLRVFDETKKANCLANDGDEMEIGELTWENVFEKKLKNETFEGEVSEEELWNAYRNAYFQISELADVNAQ
jgi:exonuclease SbcD